MKASNFDGFLKKYIHNNCRMAGTGMASVTQPSKVLAFLSVLLIYRFKDQGDQIK